MANKKLVGPYSVKEALLPNEHGGYTSRWYIYRDYRPVEVFNRYLNRKSRRCNKTGRTYAYSLVAWLNFLDLREFHYYEATSNDVDLFVDHLVYGMYCNSKVLTIDPRITYRSLYGAITAIQGFYRWFEGKVDVFIPKGGKEWRRNQKVRSHKRAAHSFLYGQIYELSVDDVIDMDHRSLKSSGYKKHWLTEGEKKAILSNLSKARDKAIFMLLCEGMRIDEVLSIKYSSYDPIEMTLKPSRSKGYSEEYEGKMRLIAFHNPLTAEHLDNYIATERADVETDLDDYLVMMFVNIKNNDKSYGKTVSYRNFWEILKTATKNARIDPTEIATHVGRRTMVQELLEEGTDTETIRQILGWASPEQLDNYRDMNSKKIIKEAAQKSHRVSTSRENVNNTNDQVNV